MPIAIGLWLVGVVLIAIGGLRANRVYGRLAELDRLADNARRYDNWRGGRGAQREPEETGADVMRRLLRRQLLSWAAVAAAGAILLLAGLVAG